MKYKIPYKYFTFSLLLSVMLLTACSPKAKLEERGTSYTLQNTIFKIDHVNEIEWAVGNHRARKVSQGIVATFEIPRIDKDDMTVIEEKFFVDSWIAKVLFDKGNQIQEVGFVLIPFHPKHHGRIEPTQGTKSFSLNFSYAAATHSERFRRFQCPAFGHRYRITDMDVKNVPAPESIQIAQMQPVNGTPQMIELTPLRFNMGMNLKGKIRLEYALYSQKFKSIRSQFTPSSQEIEIDEEIISIPECEGVHPELTPP